MRYKVLMLSICTVLIQPSCAHVRCAFGSDPACASFQYRPPVTPAPAPSPPKLDDRALNTAQDIENATRASPTVYIDSASFFSPDQFLGRLIPVYSRDGTCPIDYRFPKKIEFLLERISGFEVVSNPSPAPVAELVTSSSIAGGSELLGYLSTTGNAKSLYSLAVSDGAVARIDSSAAAAEKLKAAIDSFRSAHNSPFLEERICWLYVVEGAIQVEIVRKQFDETDASLSGGAFGLKVNGKYYSSNSAYVRDRRWGLDIAVLKRPSVPGSKGVVLPVLSAIRPAERATLRGIQSVDERK